MTQGSNGRTTDIRQNPFGPPAGSAPSSGESSDTPDSEAGRRAISPDDALPPVEPPTAGFIIKLFLVPALIVGVVLGVVLSFQWIARSEANVETYLSAIERGANNAWQCANDLAYLIRQDAALQADPQVAQRLSKIVIKHIESGPPRGRDEKELKSEVQLRVFLCKVLGEMTAPEASTGLIEAARRPRDNGPPDKVPPATTQAESEALSPELAKLSADSEIEVRKAALEGIALLAHHLQSKKVSVPAELLAVVLEVAAETGLPRQRAIRERAAYALGVLGGDAAIARLRELVDAQMELHANVRFNAATGLARQGIADPKALAVLRDMIDPEESVAGTIDPADISWTTEKITEQAAESIRANIEALIRYNGLTAVQKLVEAKADFDAGPLLEAIEALLQHPSTVVGVKNKAFEVQNLLQKRAP